MTALRALKREKTIRESTEKEYKGDREIRLFDIHSNLSTTNRKRKPHLKGEVFFLAEMERFELSIPFWGIHDFQSCALDQLRDISTFAQVSFY